MVERWEGKVAACLGPSVGELKEGIRFVAFMFAGKVT